MKRLRIELDDKLRENGIAPAGERKTNPTPEGRFESGDSAEISEERFEGSLGAMRDAADELDQIVEQAMRNRRERPWRHAEVE
jgi:hypothetical protein